MGFSRQEYWSGVPLPSPHKEMTGGQRGLGGPKLVESEDECKISVSLRPYGGGHEMAKSQLLQDLVRLDFIWSLMSSH